MHRLPAIAALAALAFVSTSPAPARADVIPRDMLFKILDATPKLVRKPSPDSTLRDLRYYEVKGSAGEGYVDPGDDDYGYLRNGADLLIVPLGSGGTGGVFATLLFTTIKTHPQFIGLLPSINGHLSVKISSGQIEASTPNYGPKDPNCCPSSTTYTTYALDGLRLKKIDERTDP